jgi:prephenate dehydrogenase
MDICVVGVGLLGGSFSLGLKSLEEKHHFYGVDINLKHAELALSLGLIDEIISFEEGVKKADLVVLATPVNVLTEQLPAALDILKPGAVVIDLGSTKELLNKTVADHPKRNQYVACHPMAGTENSGPDSAFSGLLKHKQMIICDSELSNPTALGMIVQLFRKLDMRISLMESVEHDRHIAYVSHLSHISSFALGLTVLEKEKDEQSVFEMAGGGFSSTVRLAKSSPDMWAPIFKQNIGNVSKALEDYINQLKEFKEILEEGSEEKSHELMKRANDIRRVLMGIRS